MSFWLAFLGSLLVVVLVLRLVFAWYGFAVGAAPRFGWLL